MKTTKSITYSFTLAEVEKSLDEYNAEMLLELAAAMWPGSFATDTLGRKQIRNFALLASNRMKLEKAMEKAGICWLTPPTHLNGWTQAVRDCPCIFFHSDTLEQMTKDLQAGLDVIVEIDGLEVDVQTMLENF